MDSYLTAEIFPSEAQANLRLLRGILAPGVKLCAVVKSDCYGLGVSGLLGAISELADCLAVATPQEAIALRDLGYAGQVLLMFPPAAYADDRQRGEALKRLVAERITLTLAAADDVALVAGAAAKLGATAEVHVKIDTGMSRGGVRADLAPGLVRRVRDARHLRLAGLYTHFARADEADRAFTDEQLDLFGRTVEACGGGEGLVLHAANSSATMHMPRTHLDMVRPGIAVYGYQPCPGGGALPLRPALRLWGRLMQVKEVRAGAGCGYGLTHTFQRDGRIGLVPVGYADGYLRSLSNKATMRVAGRDVPVVGRVSMDQTTIDLTDVPRARVGDEVEIISNDPAAPHSVENLARLAGTIPYELITGIGPRARRVVVEGTYVSEAPAGVRQAFSKRS